jgi:hypothetical protein
LLLPWICFSLFFLPLYVRMIRVRLIETLGEQYVVTARAKGASERRVVVGHVLRNAIAPVLPMAAADAGTALTAAIYIEVVFAMPGLGREAVFALGGASGGYDRPLVVGIVLTVATFVVLLTVASDIGTAWLDPRVRVQASSGLFPVPRALKRHKLPVTAKRTLVVVGAAVLVAGLVTMYAIPTGGKAATLVGPTRVVKVDWTETHALNIGPAPGSVEVRVRKVELGRQGWRVTGGVTNKGTSPIQIYAGTNAARENGFSLVYATRSQGYNTLVVANAGDFRPALPNVLNPGESWNGTFAGVEVIPADKQFYVGYGIFGPPGLNPNSLFGTSILTEASGVTPKMARTRG